MLKILNDEDRRTIKLSDPAAPFVLLTTRGIGGYSCENCVFHQAAGGPFGESTCAEVGVPAQVMPCTASPKSPMKWFKPKDLPSNLPPNPASYTLEQALVMLGAVTRRVDAAISEVGTPFRVGNLVSFIHNHTIQQGVVMTLHKDQGVVEVEFTENGAKTLITLPFGTVMVPPSNT